MALTDQAIVKIKDMILAGELRPGDRLPPEKELSESLGLSRSSLREAVKALEIVHVLDVRRGDGTYVTSLRPEVLLGALSFFADIHQDSSVLELFAVRRILEPAAGAMAAARATPADIAQLRSLLAEVREGTSVDDLVAHDLVFHRTICQLSGNAYLTGLLDTLSGSTLRARVWRGITDEGAVERTLTEHRAIVDALESADPELVSSQVTVHVSGVANWLQRALGAPASTVPPRRPPRRSRPPAS
ncbi:MAG: GntR family transcriptional regulator, transcriptional repressor for pyruvate dehydrogenase complex [Actinomycetota bacterium]|jgi:GntR family transcriptional repressor for pyruvate dehydrogenase complex|nr:GntR family transcriptional regulator, transcriptional repressor for pyruvate dehydrogenase complex [Actinomycetota bacterium]